MTTSSSSGHMKISLKAAELLVVCLGFSAKEYEMNT